MPEQLTKHPEVTLQVLRSAGAQCDSSAAPEILTQCPAGQFCKLPGGELCVYGLPQASQMTQVSAAEWQALGAAVAAQPTEHPLEPLWLIGALLAALIAGLLLGYLGARRRGART
jgi:hypothetical protein